MTAITLTDIRWIRWVIKSFGGFGTVYNAVPFDPSKQKEVIVKRESDWRKVLWF